MASVHRHGRHQDRSGRAAHGRARSLGSLFSDEHRAADVYPDPVLAIAIWFVIVQALQPLNKTARAVAKRSPSSMTPIDTEGLPYELKSLVDAINSLMSRLGDSLSAQQRFASDAAHELRTPLAAIKLQAQLLSRAKDPETRAKYAPAFKRA